MTSEHRIIGWIGWFANEDHTELEIYKSSNTKWEQLPSDRCLGFVLFESMLKGAHPADNKRYHTDIKLAGYDWYFKSGEIYGADNDTRLRDKDKEIKERYKNAQVIRGMWTTLSLFKAADEQMNAIKLAEGEMI